MKVIGSTTKGLRATTTRQVSYLDGINDYIRLPVVAHGAQDLSFSIQFIIPTGFVNSAFSRLFNLTNTTSINVMGFFYLGFFRVQAPFVNLALYDLTTLTRDVWHELIVTFDGVNGTSQMDGGTINTASATGSASTTSGGWYIGSKNTTQNFTEIYTRRVATGTIASPEIAVFNSPYWLNEGVGSDGVISGAIAVDDPTL